MSETTTVTPLDVALELVATKAAIVNLLGTIIGISPVLPDEAHEWAYESPVDLPRDADGWLDEEFAERLYARSEAIEVEIMAAAGRYLSDRASELTRLRAGEPVAERGLHRDQVPADNG